MLERKAGENSIFRIECLFRTMTTAFLIIICSLVIVAYLFDISAAKTKIPSVILLLALGGLLKYTTILLDVQVPDLQQLLPLLGTVGLILIVLEGSLELELSSARIGLVKRSVLSAFVPMLVLAVILAAYVYFYTQGEIKNILVNVLPLCVISSAIAIPTVKNLSAEKREFIVYESSLSDILGVLFFNFLAFNEVINGSTTLQFFLQLVLIVLVSVVATAFLAFLIGKIKHHVKFIPIISLMILIYAICKYYHLPSLLFIMVFGVVLNNIRELKRWANVQSFSTEHLSQEVHRFKEIVTEGAFLIRIFFFIIFGFLIEPEEVINPDTLTLSLLTTLFIFVIRAVWLRVTKVDWIPLLFIAPRGLISILLFISVPVGMQMNMINRSLLIQVVLLTALVMMMGMLIHKPNKNT